LREREEISDYLMDKKWLRGLLIILVSTGGKLREGIFKQWFAELDIKPSNANNMVFSSLRLHHNCTHIINVLSDIQWLRGALFFGAKLTGT
jgi:hypothetical protein